VRRSRCSLEGVGGGDNRVRGSGPLQPWGKGASGPQEHRRNDGDAIVPAVGVRTGRDDCGIQKVVADLASQPVKVSYIVVTDGPGELYLEGDHPLVWTHDDQVDLVTPVLRSQVTHLRLPRLRIDPDALRDQRFEEVTEQGAVSGDVQGGVGSRRAREEKPVAPPRPRS
jgi:hypothetical protein